MVRHQNPKDKYASQYKSRVRKAIEFAAKSDDTKFIFYAGKAFGVLDHVKYEDILFSRMNQTDMDAIVVFTERLMRIANKDDSERVRGYELKN